MTWFASWELMPSDWIYENVFHLSEDQYDEYRDLIIQDAKRKFRLAQIERTLRTRQMIVRANASFDAQYGAVPSDFLETKSLKLTSTNPQTPLSFLSIDALDNEAANYTASGKPKFFGVVGGQFRIVPTPDANWAKVSAYVEANKANGYDTIVTQLNRKYQMSNKELNEIKKIIG